MINVLYSFERGSELEYKKCLPISYQKLCNLTVQSVCSLLATGHLKLGGAGVPQLIENKDLSITGYMYTPDNFFPRHHIPTQATPLPE